jgi:sulfatase modifying factor 1
MAACADELPIEPEVIVFGEAEIVISQDSLVSSTEVFNFEPTFIGRDDTLEIKIEYRDTLGLELLVATSDTTFSPSPVFKVDPKHEHITFTKKNKMATISLIFTPDYPVTTELGYLILKRYVQQEDSLEAADTLGVDYFRLAGVEQSFYLDLEMVFISGNTFTMGLDSVTAATDTASIDEIGEHQVTLSDFFIGRYEVTNIQYYEFWIEDDTREPPRDTLGIGMWPKVALDKPNHPVVGVSWYDAVDFCRWLSLRTGEHYSLPTEAQWEYAATGGVRQKWPWSFLPEDGEEEEASEPPGFADLVNTRMSGDGYTYTAPVDAFQPGVSAFGIYNMAGNVWEWCLDWYHEDYYKFFLDKTVVDPQGPDDPEHRSFKVVRGGSWLDDLHEARCSNRGALYPSNKEISVGFRVVKLP